MNKVLITGRIVRDPDVKNAGQTNVARFTVAVNRPFVSKDNNNNQPQADFIPCIAFGKTADIVEKYFKKGMKADIEGRWQTGNYKDKNNNTVYTNDCIVEHIEFGESKKSDNATSTSAPAPQTADFTSVPDNVDDSGLPF